MAAVLRASQMDSERLDAFIQELVPSYLEQKEQQSVSDQNSCASVEGLASYIAYMNERNRGDDSLAIRSRDLASRLMKTNRRLQITPDFARTLPGGTAYPRVLERYQGAYVRYLQEPLMQVDYTQHCHNALLRMIAAGVSAG
jgi:hypothetical protein